MFGSFFRVRILNISRDQGWSNLPRAFEEAQHLQKLVEQCWLPSTNTVSTMLNYARLAAYEAERGYQQVQEDFIAQRELQIKLLQNRLTLIGVLLLTLAACFYVTPLVYVMLQVLDLIPLALTGLYTLTIITVGVITFLNALRLSTDRKRWLQINKLAQFKVSKLTASPQPVEVMSRFLDQISMPLSDWIKQLQDYPPPHFAHKGLSGELRLIRNLAGMDLTEGANADNEFVIVVHGLLLDEALDGDVILICSRGIFLLECKDWKGLTEFKAGTWIHMIESDHPDAVHGWLYKEEADPMTQFKREKKALDHILQAALPDLSKDVLHAWQDGGVAFTHIAGELRIEDEAAVPCGDIDFWRQRIMDRPPIEALDFAMQLRIAQALLNHAGRSDTAPEPVRDAAVVLVEVFGQELDRLSNDNYFSQVQARIDAYNQLIVKVKLEHMRLQAMLEGAN